MEPMLAKRVIVCLDVDGGRVVKGVRFRDLRDIGDPAALASRYEAEGADEVVFLDISASVQYRSVMLDAVRRTAERLFVPLTVGGGITSVEDVSRALRAGADKVGINTAAARRPALLSEAAAQFGSQCVVASIDADRDASMPSGYRVFTHGGRRPTDLDALDWARRCAEFGAGEILLTAIHRDGGRQGFDVDLTRRAGAAVTVPVIASGGGGEVTHFVEVLDRGRADAALAAGIFHDGLVGIADVKAAIASAGLPVRWAGAPAAPATVPGGTDE
jgi:imidazole glycerol-phosphate synthase subunit HisF